MIILARVNNAHRDTNVPMILVIMRPWRVKQASTKTITAKATVNRAKRANIRVRPAKHLAQNVLPVNIKIQTDSRLAQIAM